MDVRIFKVISGEMIIGQLQRSDDDRPLARRDTFDIEGAVILHFNGHGFGLVPLYPWADPKGGAVATFSGSVVMCEADPKDPVHASLIREYSNLVSRIQLATPGTSPTGRLSASGLAAHPHSF